MSPITPEKWREVSPHLDFALSLPEEERARWLASFRAEHRDLGAFLEELLEEHRALGKAHFLESEPVRPSRDASLAGQVLGTYKLVSRIGDGGMSSVWRAERVDGRFERQVAVKFLHFAVGSPAAAQRFKREGRILGQLAHPHIAELIDAGVTLDAEPYLVLEYVSGKQIDEYCDEHMLGVDSRIALFLDVLGAVEHAHASLVVHRDIKPSNVLVSIEGDVKLLDFGIAKLLAPDADPSSATALTLEDGTAMTPLFAAPEQLTGGAITTATDVYSLGLLLYLMLTGNHPAGAGPHSPLNLLKSITEVDAPLASQTVVLNRAAAARHGATPEKLRRRLRGDLDTILAKALKKKPAERYASVAAFADDLRRYTENQPIAARPEAASYRLRKYVQRHRFGAALTAGLALLLVGFLLIQEIELRRITLQRDRADRIANFMTGIFQVSDPNEGNGQGVTAREVLDKAANDIGSNLSQDPQLQVQMLNVMARAYLNLGLFSRAESLFKKGIEASRLYGGENERATLVMRHDLAWAIFQQGRITEAEAIERQLLDTQRRLFGPEDPDALDTVEELAFTVCDEGKGPCAEGVDLTRHVLDDKKRRLGPDAFHTLGTMDNLAIMLAEAGRYDEGIELQKDSVERHMRVFGADNIGTVDAMLNLGEFQRDAGRDDEAIRTWQDLLQTERRVLAPDQGETAATEYDLASVLLRKGQKEEALTMLRESIEGGLAPRIALGLPTDPFFTPLRKDPRFTALVAQAQKQAGSEKTN